MKVIENPGVYDDKEPTNLRLEKDLKEAVKEEAEKRGVSMSDIVNDVLAERYKK